MFKVKNKTTNEIVQVLDTYCDEYGKTWFLLWVKNKWAWRSADLFVPPNYIQKYKYIVAGSRDFQNYPFLCQVLDEVKDEIEEIVCGEARGADTLGRNYAYKNNIPVKSFPANWSAYGKSAGFMRNAEMANYADKAIVFWNGKSPGTEDMINKMKQLGKDIQINYYDKPGTD